MTEEQELEIIVKALDSKKAEKISVIKVKELTILGNYFVIASAATATQVKALADEVEYQTEQKGLTPKNIEGIQSRNWIILDYIDVIVHVFTNEALDFYKLEHLWADGEHVDISQWTSD